MKLQNRRILKPKKKSYERQSDMFRPRLVEIVNPAHPQVRLTLSSTEFGAWAKFLDSTGKAQPARLMAGMMFLQHLHNPSDEALMAQ